MIKWSLTLSFLIISLLPSKAREGMWIPTLIEQQIIGDLQTEGLQLSSDDIYNVNKACLKDAVLKFSNGCSAGFISDKGLIITNHHCSDDFIQALSSTKKNYLKDGYWSSSYDNDLPVDGLSVEVLEYMEDVTEKVLLGVDETMNEIQRKKIIRFNTNKLQDSLQQNRKFEAIIKPFYKGNQYIAFISTEYNDVRLVGAPSVMIADFGGDTDNWEWPRHGADFALFRVYANSKNMPSFYDSKNIPFIPKKSLSISLGGVKKDDFTMVLGFPATTDLYATSYKLKMLKDDIYPVRIALRSIKLDVLNSSINQSDALRLKYSAKASTISNSWKRWQGEILGLNQFKVIEQKILKEQTLSHKIKSNPAFTDKHLLLFEDFKRFYEELTALSIPNKCISELTGKNGLETIAFADIFPSLKEMSDSSARKNLQYYVPRIKTHFRNFDKATDKQLTTELLGFYIKNIPTEYIPQDLQDIDVQKPKALKKYVDHLFQDTHFADSAKLLSLLEKAPDKIEKQISSDPANRLNKQFSFIQKNMLLPSIKLAQTKLDSLNRVYMEVLIRLNNEPLLADANSSFRVAYGHIQGYSPKDGIDYLHYTTLDGIFEKEALATADYKMDHKLKKHYINKDFGPYETGGTIPVCFLASNHTSGGNSGSPVLNASGELIGLNFDRAWEGIVSDFYYTPDICRNISVDIRYVLFIIDKFAGAKYLLDEINIVE